MLQLAQELGKPSKAWRILGYSRPHFYEIHHNFQVHGAGGLLDRLPRAKGRHLNGVASPIEKAVLAHALKHPTQWAQRVADELMLRGLRISSGGVRGVWIRNGFKTRHERLLRLEETVRKRKIKLTEEQIRVRESFDPEFRERHIEVHAWARLYTSKMPVTAVQILNNHVLPFFEEQGVKIQTILSDNGREYCGRPGKHPYELFLQLEDIEHRTTKVGRP